MNSLQLRLSLGLLISLIGVFLTLWWLSSSTIRTLAEESLAENLSHNAQSILAAIQIDSNNKANLNSALIEPVFNETFSGNYYQVQVNDQILRSPSLKGFELALPAVQTGTSNKLYLSGPEQQMLMVMIYGYRKQGQAVTVAVAEDLSQTLVRISAFEYRFGLLALLLLAILIALQLAILRNAFSPLRRIQKQIRALDQGDIWQLDPQVPQEVSALKSQHWSLS